ncbi:hypothetical protein PVAP13_8KG059100 [Panicum virgatum]|uniref:Uncharacterized protein n=1 Tax=Panicum virgatum TaxID=38727 RepID=A0A8T0PEV2_PANVG|nr:hypothetical protein PVAP13_8KG059100 [Panicum virgatum]
MAIPVARVHLAMAHAALPGLLPTPPKCMMLPLLPAPPCAVILPNNWQPRRPSRADAAGRWDAHKTKPAGSPASSSSSGDRASSNGISRADSDERWDAHKKPASPASSSSAISNKTKTWRVSRRPNGQRSSSSAERWDAQKKPQAPQPADELDDGESSTGSNDVESFMPPRSFYAGPGFITSPEPSMLPKPSFMIRVA